MNTAIDLFFENQMSRLFSKIRRPVYHYHIRKTGGTTINFAFISTLNPENVEIFYEQIASHPMKRKRIGLRSIVGWNKPILETGSYFYGFSHLPSHKIKIPENAFKITCLRDPVKRVVSHYNMLCHYKENRIDHPCMQTEGKWLGNGFSDFLERMPREHLENQLYMFSDNFDAEEAIRFIHDKGIFLLHTEQLDDSLKKLGHRLNLDLKISRQKGYQHSEALAKDEMDHLHGLLKEEYLFFDHFKNIEC